MVFVWFSDSRCLAFGVFTGAASALVPRTTASGNVFKGRHMCLLSSWGAAWGEKTWMEGPRRRERRKRRRRSGDDEKEGNSAEGLRRRAKGRGGFPRCTRDISHLVTWQMQMQQLPTHRALKHTQRRHRVCCFTWLCWRLTSCLAPEQFSLQLTIVYLCFARCCQSYPSYPLQDINTCGQKIGKEKKTGVRRTN